MSLRMLGLCLLLGASGSLLANPVLQYSSYLGGVGYDAGAGIAVDRAGNVYITGETASGDFPGASNASRSWTRHAFVTKLAAGTFSVVYTTVLASSGNDAGRSIALAEDGTVWVAGTTSGADFPVTSNALQRDFGPPQSAFVARLDTAGRLAYATYLGKDGTTANGVAIDPAGNVLITGATASPRFPTTATALQRTFQGGFQDAFLTRLSSDGGALLYSSYLGGSGNDIAQGVAVDPAGNACIAGYTDSANLPVANALRSSPGGNGDAFVGCLNLDSSGWTYITYLGDAAYDTASGIAMDGLGNAYVAGATASPGFPATARSFARAKTSDFDAFVTKLSRGGALLYSMLIGGAGSDAITGVALDAQAQAWVAGYTSSFDFPNTGDWPGGYQGNFDGFLAELNAAGNQLLLAGCVGGGFDDRAMAVATAPGGGAFITGLTASTNFLTTAAARQTANSGSYDAFLTWIAPPAGTLSIRGSVLDSHGVPLNGVTVALGGSQTISALTEASGGYEFSGLASGAGYTVTPSESGLAFSPKTANLLSLSAPQTINFRAQPAANLAPAAQARQRTTYAPGTEAWRAVDGNTNGAFWSGSVTHTNLEANPWWEIDLGASATVFSITVWNRTDCCADRLGDYWVFLSDKPFGSADVPATLVGRPGTWSTHQTTAPNPGTSIAVGGVAGRYVRVQLSGTNYLSLSEVQVFAAMPDIATGRTATQSSTGFGGYPANAVDGSTDGTFSHGSVTHTGQDAYAWWQVDLGASTTISAVGIWNRTDCCSSRLSDYWLFVSDTPFAPSDVPASLQNRPGTWGTHQTTTPNPLTSIGVGGARGRYVRVQLAGMDYLSLAEVQVLGAWPNLALGKSAVQSSIFAGAGADRALDGNTDGRFLDGSVTHTGLDPNAWWQVDLGASAVIDSIVIWNRTDCCADRLSDFWVFVSDQPFSAGDSPSILESRPGTWSRHEAAPPSPAITVPLSGAVGRYVRIQLAGTDYLSLAEVQVFGSTLVP